MTQNEQIADGLDKLIEIFTPEGSWHRPGFAGSTLDRDGNVVDDYSANGFTRDIGAALFYMFPGPYVPLRGLISSCLATFTDTSMLYYWENAPGRTHADVMELLNKAFAEVMEAA